MSLIVDFNFHDKNRENRAKIEDDTLNSFDEMNTIRIITWSILISKYDTRWLSCGDYRKVLKITSTKIYQGQIQTTFTYANAEVTFSVVKFLKNTGIPIFSTKLLSSFLLPIEKIRKS